MAPRQPIMLGQVGYQRTADLARLATQFLDIRNCPKGRPIVGTKCQHCSADTAREPCAGVVDNPPLEDTEGKS